MAASFTLPTVLANLTAGNQPLSLIDGDLTTLRDPLLALSTFANYYTDTGAANAYSITVSAPQTVSQAAGLPIQFKATNANTGASTFQINALAAKNILNMDGTAQNYLAGVTGVGVVPSSTTNLILALGTTGVSSLRIPHGAAPTSPVNGDMWTTTAGLFVRINGATVGPLS